MSVAEQSPGIYELNVAAVESVADKESKYLKLRRSERRLWSNRFNIAVEPMAAVIGIIGTHPAIRHKFTYQLDFDLVGLMVSGLFLGGAMAARDRRVAAAREVGLSAVPIIQQNNMQLPGWVVEAVNLPTLEQPGDKIEPSAYI